MTKIDTSTAAVERVAARGDVYIFEDHQGVTNVGVFIRTLAAERDALAARLAEVERERDAQKAKTDEWRKYCHETHDLLMASDEALATARAETAAMVERAADWIEFAPEGKRSTDAAAIRALTPSDATAALDQIRRQERAAGKAEGMREAAKKATSFLVGDPANGVPLRNPMAHEIADAILALIEKGVIQ